MFGGKKTKAEKDKEKALKRQEMEQQIAEYKNKKNKDKGNKSGKQLVHNRNIDAVQSDSANSKQNLSSSDSSNSDNAIEGVVTLRRRSQNGAQISPQEFNQRASEFFEKQSQEKRYREIVTRIQRNDMVNISEMLSQSQDTFSFYREFMKTYNNEEILVALDILDKSDIELFKYIINNDLVNELYQGEVQLYNQQYMRHERDEFFEFRKKHPQFQVEHTALDEYLPHIYLLGDENDFKLVDAMSLSTEVNLLSEPKDVQTFAQDESYKVILLFELQNKEVNTEVIKDYLQVKSGQDFPIFSTFPLSDIKKEQQIVPFNRDNLVKMTSLK